MMSVLPTTSKADHQREKAVQRGPEGDDGLRILIAHLQIRGGGARLRAQPRERDDDDADADADDDG